jgi:hypothetical protein
MEDTQRYISLLNIERFSDQLLTDCDRAMRSTVMKLLVAEEDRLGSCYEQLDRLRWHIQRCNDVVERQLALIARMEERGRDIVAAERLLSCFLETKALYEKMAAKICRELEDSRL